MSATLPPPSWRKRHDGGVFALSLALSVALNAAVLTLPAWFAGEPEEHVFLLVTTGEYAVEAAVGSVAAAGRAPAAPEERRFAEAEEQPERAPEKKPEHDAPALPENASPSPFANAAPPEAQDAPEAREREKPDAPKRAPERPQPPERASPDLRAGAAPGTRGVRRRARRSEGSVLMYPYESRLRGESGVALIVASVGADGACLSARVERSSGFPRLDAAALDAVRQSRFEPATLDGEPVASEETLEIAFELE